ncbi:MAG TPA: hybrid sensor histidine kinase/response regulator [Cyanobacteria bacterium UBA11366]|nr:hybrid sensor histidine kinase/response regulator [Cyanobacteria bacterium UBA11366]HCA96391.1 hybrid sensor histidine kinase/response regulator [Cyanobacteria bacterium UBA9226]
MTVESNETSKILIVDDNPTNLGLIFEYLTDAGFKVLVALDGESAIQQAEYSKPDLILLDVMMPGIDGFQTCSLLKANQATQDIPVIFMTALCDTGDKVTGFNVGAVDYITKPIQPTEVLCRVKTHLTLRNLQKQLEKQNEELLRSQAKERQRTLELEETLKKLQKTQTQLFQADKMSSIGQMVAGVAHEINNPLNFIYSNLSLTKQYTQQILELIELYQKTYGTSAPEINDKIEELDLEFLEEDLPKMLKSMEVGAERICQIVLLLKNFCHIDEAQRKLTDIHEGIDSTLLLLHHRLKAKGKKPEIYAIKEYGDLPKVRCNAGQINQVFMNILVNAIDALEDKIKKSGMDNKNIEERRSLSVASCVLLQERDSELKNQTCDLDLCPIPTIKIKTDVVDNNRITISISDNGLGMTEDVQRRLFDAFFTTKPVGSGTGLGLTISYQIIVEKHQGKLSFNSEFGRGSEFIIEIPISQ